MFKRVSTVLTMRLKTKKVPESETTGQHNKDSTAATGGWLKAYVKDNGSPRVEGNLTGTKNDTVHAKFALWEFTAVRLADGSFDVTTGDRTINCTDYTEFDYTDNNNENYRGWIDPTIK